MEPNPEFEKWYAGRYLNHHDPSLKQFARGIWEGGWNAAKSADPEIQHLRARLAKITRLFNPGGNPIALNLLDDDVDVVVGVCVDTTNLIKIGDLRELLKEVKDVPT